MIELLGSWDRNLFLFLNSFHLSWLNPIMVLLSGKFLWIPLVLFSFWSAKKNLSLRHFWVFGLFLSMALVASDVTSSYIIKNIFTRLRPCRMPELLPLIHQFGQKCGGKFGFVSSHAANSFALVSYTLFSLEMKNQKWHLLWILPSVVSMSRIYLGVHFPGDIIVGALVGISWGSFLAWSFKKT